MLVLCFHCAFLFNKRESNGDEIQLNMMIRNLTVFVNVNQCNSRATHGNLVKGCEL